ncbi:DinB family protein [Kineococcus radiotolerans]|uniref:Mini-circle protein n=1 Tax=Kineococcus radiotolerans (strain ATCC BAA-149 / DSM 14245 / SRS30216) TaxID=266940 RepID=A6WH46_KINRD|nr:DinB family protein [Kineococcus radiotolerans]ABS06135.1 protein of unknown function DUF664 [Kineococcus radiotolerans SRS30216 = ATCC BAA-149]
MSKRVPLRGEEKASLHISLDRHRDAVLWKLEGLDEEQLRRPMTPTGTNLLGLVKHLAGVEYEWLPKTYGRATEPLETDVVADMNAGPHESTADIVAFYGRARAASDAVIAEHGIDDVGTAWFGEQVSLRRVLIGLVEETARHAGHMDILRELIDGAIGSHRPD